MTTTHIVLLSLNLLTLAAIMVVSGTVKTMIFLKNESKKD